MTFHPDDGVEVRPLALDPAMAAALRERFLLFFTGEARSASDMFGHQVSRTLAGDAEMTANLDRTKESRARCAPRWKPAISPAAGS